MDNTRISHTIGTSGSLSALRRDVSIVRGQARLFLSEHRGDQRPDTLIGLFVKDIDTVVAEFGRPEEEPPYGCEFELRDPDGNRPRITQWTT